MIEDLLKELIDQLTKLNANLAAPSEVDGPEVAEPKTVAKTVAPKEADAPEAEAPEAEASEAPDVKPANIKALATRLISDGLVTKEDIKGKIQELGAKNLADCSPKQLAAVYAFLKAQQ